MDDERAHLFLALRRVNFQEALTTELGEHAWPQEGQVSNRRARRVPAAPLQMGQGLQMGQKHT